MKGIAVRGLMLAGLFAAVAALALHLNVSDSAKPIDAASGFMFVGFMLVAGGVWWSACRVVRRGTYKSGRTVWIILAFALLFRAIVIFAPPILELDLYRYLWDGWVSTQGVSPFRYSPSEVIESVRFGELEKDETLRSLAAEVERNPAAAELVDLVHYPDLTTVYPAASQGLFAICAMLAPTASVKTRVLVMKGALLTIEIATWLLVAVLLLRTNKPIEWLILPMWCPLAVLSVANQGHLDSFPGFLAIAALVVASGSPTIQSASVSGLLLGLASGAKVYPLLLAPLIAFFLWRRSGGGRLSASGSFVASFLVSSAILWVPLVHANRWEGFRAFASHWEINDSVFAVVSENLRRDDSKSRTAWYVFTPNSWRQGMAVPDAVARGVWIGASASIGLVLLIGVWRFPSSERLLRSSYLLLAWFWALGPVCNPWYLLWILPLLPFVQNPGWTLLFAIAPAMFLRFPMAAQFGNGGEHWYDHGLALAIAASWMATLLANASSALPPGSSHSANPTESLRDRG